LISGSYHRFVPSVAWIDIRLISSICTVRCMDWFQAYIDWYHAHIINLYRPLHGLISGSYHQFVPSVASIDVRLTCWNSSPHVRYRITHCSVCDLLTFMWNTIFKPWNANNDDSNEKTMKSKGKRRNRLCRQWKPLPALIKELEGKREKLCR